MVVVWITATSVLVQKALIFACRPLTQKPPREPRGCAPYRITHIHYVIVFPPSVQVDVLHDAHIGKPELFAPTYVYTTR